MRRTILAAAGALLLAGSTILAFASGGFFAEPRLIAAIVAWAIVRVPPLLAPPPLPASRAGRVAGARDRRAWRRAAAAGGAPALGLATYISLSRGALAAAAAGLVVVVAAAPTWSQLRAAAVTVGGSAIAAAASAPLAGFGS